MNICAQICKEREMTYQLRILSRTADEVVGEWNIRSEYRGMFEWAPFTYKRQGEYFEGEWALPVGAFYEYYVTLDPITGTGSGENRYGKFVITQVGPDQWTKKYTELHYIARRNIPRRSRQIARLLRTTFRDKLERLERAVLANKLTIVDVREVLKLQPPALVREFELKLIAVNKQALERIKRQEYEKKVNQLEGRIASLKQKIYAKVTELGMVHFRIGAEYKEQLGTRTSESKLRSTVWYHEAPLTGVVVNNDLSIHSVKWSEISDELYLELNS